MIALRSSGCCSGHRKFRPAPSQTACEGAGWKDAGRLVQAPAHPFGTGKALGIERKAFLQLVESRTHWQRSTSLAELTNAAVFLASDRASAMTGTTVNLTGGIVVD
jgi:enoyl-[acyl-carrier-protein] reductase (NADH)